MRVDGTYTVRFLGIALMPVRITTGRIRYEDGRATVEVSYDYKVIKWRRLAYLLTCMFAAVLDLQLPEPRMSG